MNPEKDRWQRPRTGGGGVVVRFCPPHSSRWSFWGRRGDDRLTEEPPVCRSRSALLTSAERWRSASSRKEQLSAFLSAFLSAEALSYFEKGQAISSSQLNILCCGIDWCNERQHGDAQLQSDTKKTSKCFFLKKGFGAVCSHCWGKQDATDQTESNKKNLIWFYRNEDQTKASKNKVEWVQ